MIYYIYMIYILYMYYCSVFESYESFVVNIFYNLRRFKSRQEIKFNLFHNESESGSGGKLYMRRGFDFSCENVFNFRLITNFSDDIFREKVIRIDNNKDKYTKHKNKDPNKDQNKDPNKDPNKDNTKHKDSENNTSNKIRIRNNLFSILKAQILKKINNNNQNNLFNSNQDSNQITPPPLKEYDIIFYIHGGGFLSQTTESSSGFLCE